MDKQQPFFVRYKCEICHKEATHYVVYRDFYSYLCASKECDLKHRIKTGIFVTSIDAEKK